MSADPAWEKPEQVTSPKNVDANCENKKLEEKFCKRSFKNVLVLYAGRTMNYQGLLCTVRSTDDGVHILKIQSWFPIRQFQLQCTLECTQKIIWYILNELWITLNKKSCVLRTYNFLYYSRLKYKLQYLTILEIKDSRKISVRSYNSTFMKNYTKRMRKYHYGVFLVLQEKQNTICSIYCI